MFFKYKNTVLPVDPTEVVVKATPTTGHPRTPWEWTLAQLHIDREYDLIHKHNVFCLTDWYCIPVDICLRPMKYYAMSCHGTGHKLHPTVRTWDTPLKILPVSVPLACDPMTESLL